MNLANILPHSYIKRQNIGLWLQGLGRWLNTGFTHRASPGRLDLRCTRQIIGIGNNTLGRRPTGYAGHATASGQPCLQHAPGLPRAVVTACAW
jgi:hypothetical protein